MVRARAGAVEELQAAIEAVRGLDDVRLELLETHQAGTGAGDDQPARLHEAERELVEVLVFAAALEVARAFTSGDTRPSMRGKMGGWNVTNLSCAHGRDHGDWSPLSRKELDGTSSMQPLAKPQSRNETVKKPRREGGAERIHALA